MSRTKDNSLDYFPLDVDFFSDPRIRRLQGRFGSDGPLFLIYIFCHCYGNKGYYIEANEDFCEDAAIDIGCSVEKIGLMLNYLLDRSLLDSTSFNTVKVLTSHGIQAQYQKSKKGCKRDIVVDGTLWLLDESETEGFVKVRSKMDNSEKKEHFSGKKDDISGKYPQSKGEERKEKERKKDIYEASEDGPEGDRHDLGTVMSLYMDHIQANPPTVHIDTLKSYTESMGAEVVEHAITKALDANALNFNYVKAVLQSYAQKKVTTLAQAKQVDQEFLGTRQRGHGYGFNGRNAQVRTIQPQPPISMDELRAALDKI